MFQIAINFCNFETQTIQIHFKAQTLPKNRYTYCILIQKLKPNKTGS